MRIIITVCPNWVKSLPVSKTASPVTQIALEPMKIVLAIFIFYLLWGPKPKFSGTSPSVRLIAGLSTAFLSVFVGASGPIVSSYLYTKEYEKLKFTATFSSCMALQHVLKAAVFYRERVGGGKGGESRGGRVL